MPNRYENEIEDLLGQINNFDIPSAKNNKAKPRRENSPNLTRPLWNFFKTKSALKIGIALLVIAALLEITGQNLSGIFAIGGGAFLIISYVLFFLKPPQSIEKKWRGQVIEEVDNQSFLIKLNRWLG
mgnify:CR=1 FL=1